MVNKKSKHKELKGTKNIKKHDKQMSYVMRKSEEEVAH